MTIDLSQLATPFPAADIEWRVSRSGLTQRGGEIWCRVLAYITARAIENRLDDVCGPENWQLTQPIQLEHERRCAIGVGISIKIGDEWVTKWDVSELTDSSGNIPPYKGGFSGAVKRAGAQWGIGRYLYHLDETKAQTANQDPGSREWHWARLSKDHGGEVYYWKTPQLPGWALPKESDSDNVSEQALHDLKQQWRSVMAPDNTNKAELVEGFERFVLATVGEFPSSDHTCWTLEALTKCKAALRDGNNVPFDAS